MNGVASRKIMRRPQRSTTSAKVSKSTNRHGETTKRRLRAPCARPPHVLWWKAISRLRARGVYKKLPSTGPAMIERTIGR